MHRGDEESIGMVSIDVVPDELSSSLHTAANHVAPNIEMVESGNQEVELELEVGKMFDSEVDAFNYYRAYGNASGFSVVTKIFKTNDNGVFVQEVLIFFLKVQACSYNIIIYAMKRFLMHFKMSKAD